MGGRPSAEKKRVYVKLDEREYAELMHWANARDVSMQEYLLEAIKYKMAYDAGDVDVPDALVQRVAQLVESEIELRSEFNNLRELIVSSMRSLLALTRGDNYLLDDADEGGKDRG